MSAGVALPIGWDNLSIVMSAGSSHDDLLGFLFAQGVTAHLDAMGGMNDAVQDGVGQSWVADQCSAAIRVRSATIRVRKCGRGVGTLGSGPIDGLPRLGAL